MWITNRTCLKKLLGKQNNAESLIHQKNWRVEQPVHSIKKGSIARFRYFRSEITNYLVLFLPIYTPSHSCNYGNFDCYGISCHFKGNFYLLRPIL